MIITSTTKFIRVAPDKLRILSQMLKNKSYDFALTQLKFSGRAAAKPLINLLKQAKDSQKEKFDDQTFFIKEIRINEGPKLKRRRILQQGRATTILKRMAHATIVLSDEKSKKNNNPIKKEKIVKQS